MIESVKEEEWISIIKGEREFSAISKKRLRQTITEGGVPQSIRGEIWCMLCEQWC